MYPFLLWLNKACPGKKPPRSSEQSPSPTGRARQQQPAVSHVLFRSPAPLPPTIHTDTPPNLTDTLAITWNTGPSWPNPVIFMASCSRDFQQLGQKSRLRHWSVILLLLLLVLGGAFMLIPHTGGIIPGGSALRCGGDVHAGAPCVAGQGPTSPLVADLPLIGIEWKSSNFFLRLPRIHAYCSHGVERSSASQRPLMEVSTICNT